MSDSRLYDSEEDIEAIEITAIENARQARQNKIVTAEQAYYFTKEKYESAKTRVELAHKEIADAISNGDAEKWQIYDTLKKEAENEAQQYGSSLIQQKEDYDHFISTYEWSDDRGVAMRANNFAKKHELSNEDINNLHRHANALIQKGYDPRTTRYWREMDKIANHYLNNDDDPPTRSSKQQKTFKLTEDHKDALRQLGIDDYNSKEAQKYIKAWANWKNDNDYVDVGR